MPQAETTGGPIVRVRRWAESITRDGYAVYLAGRDPRVPWYAKVLAITIATYAFSPIDLIPDFIPVLGLADELVLLPLGLILVVRLIPSDVMMQHRASAAAMLQQPTSRTAAAVIVAIWLALAAAAGWLVWRWFA